MKWLGFILEHILRLAVPEGKNLFRQALAVCTLALPAGVIAALAEALGTYIIYPALFDSFVELLPLRIAIYALLFASVSMTHALFVKHNRPSAPPAAQDTDEKLPDAVAGAAYADRITVRTGNKIKIIKADSIEYVKAEGDYVSICTAEGCYLKEQTMKHTESILNPDMFVRIHRSYIVNIAHIKSIERYGEYQQVALHSNEKIKISEGRYQALRKTLGL